MSRIRPRRLLEHDRADPTCPACGGPRAGHGLCTSCEEVIVQELELEDAAWWVEVEYEEPAPVGAGTWDDGWDVDDLDLSF